MPAQKRSAEENHSDEDPSPNAAVNHAGDEPEDTGDEPVQGDEQHDVAASHDDDDDDEPQQEEEDEDEAEDGEEDGDGDEDDEEEDEDDDDAEDEDEGDKHGGGEVADRSPSLARDNNVANEGLILVKLSDIRKEVQCPICLDASF